MPRYKKGLLFYRPWTNPIYFITSITLVNTVSIWVQEWEILVWKTGLYNWQDSREWLAEAVDHSHLTVFEDRYGRDCALSWFERQAVIFSESVGFLLSVTAISPSRISVHTESSHLLYVLPPGHLRWLAGNELHRSRLNCLLHDTTAEW